jgi:hypothetical protein
MLAKLEVEMAANVAALVHVRSAVNGDALACTLLEVVAVERLDGGVASHASGREDFAIELHVVVDVNTIHLLFIAS